MKAYVLRGINNINLEEVPKPVPKAGEALIRVASAGICGSDIPRIYKTGAHVHPIIPGHEFAGLVESVGSGDDEKWVGKRVGVFPLIPCKTCPECLDKKYEMCRNYNYLGSRCDGAFAEYVTVPVWNLIELPEEVNLQTAAMLEPLAVGTHAIRGFLSDSIKRDEPILIWGIGTIGLMITSILKAEGFCNIFLVGSKEYQRNVATEEIGIEGSHVFDIISDENAESILKMTEGRGFSYVFECVGKSETFEKAVEYAAPSGHVMLVGNPYSDMTLKRSIYWKILRNQLTVKGTWNSSYTKETTDDWQYVLGLIKDGKLETDWMISHKFDMDGLMHGFELMRDKSEDYIKCMLVTT